MALALVAATAVVLPAVASAAPAKATASLVIEVTKNATYGPILTEGNGFVVYRYTLDKKNSSVCTGECATLWPPVVLPKSQSVPIGKGLSAGTLGVITRKGGARQVTFDGIPLYLYLGDKPGTVTGEGVDKQWYVINPAKPTAVPAPGASPKASAKPVSSSGGIAY